MKFSSEAQYLLSYFTAEFQVINPNNFRYKMPDQFKSFQASHLFVRFRIRQGLLEINEFDPNFLLPEIRKEYNIDNNFSIVELSPSSEELTILKAELTSFIDHPQYRYIALIHSKHPKREIDSILTVGMIDARDVTDFINCVPLKEIYWRVYQRRKEIDKLFEV